MRLIPKKWADFQHYKDRCPPWIKLHRDLLNDRDFMCLPLASKALAPLLWLLASESKDGTFDASSEELAFRLRLTEAEVVSGLNPLISKGFFLDASTMLAPCLQPAIPETEREGEKETYIPPTPKGAVVRMKKPEPVRFTEFWDTWPKSERKQDKAKCHEKWASMKLDGAADKILADITTKKLSRKWMEQDGKYIESPLVYLNNRRWEDESVDQAFNPMAGFM